VSRDLITGFEVVEAHGHIQPTFADVPGFDDGDAGTFEACAHRRRMQRPGQDEAIGPTAEEGLDELFFLLRPVSRAAEQKLIAGLIKAIGDPLHRVAEDRVTERRHHPGDDAALVRAQGSSREIR
jgi:hypothetical protein